MHPPSLIHRFRGLFHIIPILFHHQVSPNADLTLLSHRHYLPLLINNLQLSIGRYSPNSRNPLLKGSIRPHQRSYRTQLSHPIHNTQPMQVHPVKTCLHQGSRAYRPRNKPSSKGRHIILPRTVVKLFQSCSIHGGHSIERSTFLFGHCLEGGSRVERSRWINHSRSVLQSH